MMLRQIYLALAPWLLLALPIAGIAYGLITSFRPNIRETAGRMLFLGFGAVMFFSSLSTLIITGGREQFLLLLFGAIWVASAVYWHDRRIRGVLGGTGMIAAGLWWAAAWLRPEDEVLFPLRHLLFVIGELAVIGGAVLAVGAWQKWPALQPVDEDEFAGPRAGIH
jgi:hypothetical protein